MSNGIQLFGSNGALTYSSTDVTWNQVDFFYIAGSGSESRSYDILSGREVLVVQIMINQPPTDRKAIAHNTSVSGTTVSVSGGSEAAYIAVLMR